MKEIIFVSNYIGNGGAGRVLSIIADFFSKKGLKVTIIIYNKIENEYKVNPNIHIQKISKSFPNIIGKLQRIIKLRRYLKKFPGATVIAFEYFVNLEAILATRGLKQKVIVSERNTPAIVDKRKFTKILRDILYKYADVLVCQTNEAKEYFSNKIKEHTVVIPNPVKSDLPIGSGERGKELVTFCRITEQKNLKMMLDAFKMVHKCYPCYYLSIYGDGNEKEKLIHYCEENGMSQYVNFFPFSLNIHEKIADCFLFLSTSDYEGLSNSMLEAMAMGIPSICTDCDGGGARMIIKDKENGMLVPKNDPIAFCNAIKYLIENEDERLRIRNNSLKIRNEYSANNICTKWLELI